VRAIVVAPLSNEPLSDCRPFSQTFCRTTFVGGIDTIKKLFFVPILEILHREGKSFFALVLWLEGRGLEGRGPGGREAGERGVGTGTSKVGARVQGQGVSVLWCDQIYNCRDIILITLPSTIY
jgi:hypothetical protein